MNYIIFQPLLWWSFLVEVAMEKKEFKGYELKYVEQLLQIAGNDVQDNSVVEGGNFLSMALDACSQFNKDYGDQYFDDGDQ